MPLKRLDFPRAFRPWHECIHCNAIHCLEIATRRQRDVRRCIFAIWVCKIFSFLCFGQGGGGFSVVAAFWHSFCKVHVLNDQLIVMLKERTPAAKKKIDRVTQIHNEELKKDEEEEVCNELQKKPFINVDPGVQKGEKMELRLRREKASLHPFDFACLVSRRHNPMRKSFFFFVCSGNC